MMATHPTGWERDGEEQGMRRPYLLAGIVAGVLLADGLVHAVSTVTIYTQNFAVVRDTLSLNLKKGLNEISVTDIATRLEPDSVILRDPTGTHGLRILEQSFRAEPGPDGKILKPALQWLLEADEGGSLNADLAYVTGGMRWEANYNVILSEKGDLLDVVAWVTMVNQSGKTFHGAKITLAAGDVNKLQTDDGGYGRASTADSSRTAGAARPISEKPFGAYPLFTLNREVTLNDRETKQVEIVRSVGTKGNCVYVYDGAAIDAARYRGYPPESIRQERDYGAKSNPQVWVMWEIQNSAANHLGMPLPAGRSRLLRRDEDGRLEFVGENVIDHTPRDGTLRVFGGAASGLMGSRMRSEYKIDNSRNSCDEAFEIRLKNESKKDIVEVRVMERLYRGTNWEVVEKSHSYLKTEAQAIEFRVQLDPGEEEVLKYRVHYTW